MFPTIIKYPDIYPNEQGVFTQEKGEDLSNEQGVFTQERKKKSKLLFIFRSYIEVLG